VCVQEKRGPGQHCLFPRVHPCLFTFSSSYLATCPQGRRGHGNEFTAIVRGQPEPFRPYKSLWSNEALQIWLKCILRVQVWSFLVAFGSLRLKYYERHCKSCLNRAMGAVSYEQKEPRSHEYITSVPLKTHTHTHTSWISKAVSHLPPFLLK